MSDKNIQPIAHQFRAASKPKVNPKKLQVNKVSRFKDKKKSQAYFEGYKTGLTNHLDCSKVSDLDLTEEISLCWLDGWLDGVETVDNQQQNLS